MKIPRLFAVCVWFWLAQPVAHVHAQDGRPRRSALFKTAPAQRELTQLAAAVDPVLQAELGKITSLQVVSQPALDLPSTQLALDCVGETPSCLGLVAERTQVEVLLAPTVARTDSAVVLSLLSYDPQRQSALQVATQRVPRAEGDDAVLARVPSLLRELLGLPEPALETVATVKAEPLAPPPTAAAPGPVERQEPSLLLPIVLSAAGVAVIGAGIGLGVGANGSEDAYARRRIDTPADAARATSLYDRASTYATLANVAFGLGAAALVAGVVVFGVDHFGREQPAAAGPRVSLGLGSLSVRGTWN